MPRQDLPSVHDLHMALSSLELYVRLVRSPEGASLPEDCHESAAESIAILRAVIESRLLTRDGAWRSSVVEGTKALEEPLGVGVM